MVLGAAPELGSCGAATDLLLPAEGVADLGAAICPGLGRRLMAPVRLGREDASDPGSISRLCPTHIQEWFTALNTCKGGS